MYSKVPQTRGRVSLVMIALAAVLSFTLLPSSAAGPVGRRRNAKRCCAGSKWREHARSECNGAKYCHRCIAHGDYQRATAAGRFRDCRWGLIKSATSLPALRNWCEMESRLRLRSRARLKTNWRSARWAPS